VAAEDAMTPKIWLWVAAVDLGLWIAILSAVRFA
jgi:hypothetical protein